MLATSRWAAQGNPRLVAHEECVSRRDDNAVYRASLHAQGDRAYAQSPGNKPQRPHAPAGEDEHMGIATCPT